MPRLLKQSTAVTFRIGPFVDSTDGVTAETGLSIGQADIQISKAGGAFAQTSATTPTTTHDADGWYQCPLTTTDTNTLGMLTVQITMAGALPVWEHFEVVAANIFDSVISGTDLMDVNAAQIGGTAQTGRDIGASVLLSPGTGTGQISLSSGAVTAGTVSDKTGYSISGTLTTLDALDTAQDTQHSTTQGLIGTPTDFGSGTSTLAANLQDMADNGTATFDRSTDSLQALRDHIADGTNLTEAGGTGDHLTALATAAALATVDSNVDAILVDTGTTLETHLTDIKGATFSGATDSLEAIRDRGDAAWTTGAGGSPPQLLQSTTIATLASQTSFTLTAGSADDDAYNGAIAVVTDSATAEQKAFGTISDYTGSTKTVTLGADPGIFTMAVGDSISIITPLGAAGSGPTAAQIADAVWDEAQADHVGAGTFGEVATETAAILADTNELQTDWANGGRLDLLVDGIKAVTDVIPDSGAMTSIATAAALATVDSNVDAILVDTGTTIPAQISALNDPTAAAIAAEVWNAVQASHTTGGTFGELATEIAAILADTAELQGDWTNGGRLDLLLDAVKAVTDALPDAGALTSLATAAALATVDANVDAILTDTGTTLPATLAALNDLSAAEVAAELATYDGPTNAEMEARTPTAAQLAYMVANAATGVPVTFTGGTTTTAVLGNVDGSAASSVDDYYNGRVLIFNSGTLANQATDITDYDGATKAATITAVTTAVTSGHTARLA